MIPSSADDPQEPGSKPPDEAAARALHLIEQWSAEREATELLPDSPPFNPPTTPAFSPRTRFAPPSRAEQGRKPPQTKTGRWITALPTASRSRMAGSECLRGVVDRATLTIRSAELPEVPEGEPIPEVRPPFGE
jgi:hypothetical protein